MREREVERALIRAVAARGGEVRKVAWVGRRHAPDRLVLLPGRWFWAELKRPGEKPRPGQAREHDRLRRYGHEVLVIDSPEAVEEAVRGGRG